MVVWRERREAEGWEEGRGQYRNSSCFPPSSQILPAYTMLFSEHQDWLVYLSDFPLILKKITLCVYVFACMYVMCCEHAVLIETRRGHQILWTRVTDSCDPQCGATNWTQLFWATAEPSFHPHVCLPIFFPILHATMNPFVSRAQSPDEPLSSPHPLPKPLSAQLVLAGHSVSNLVTHRSHVPGRYLVIPGFCFLLVTGEVCPKEQVPKEINVFFISLSSLRKLECSRLLISKSPSAFLVKMRVKALRTPLYNSRW